MPNCVRFDSSTSSSNAQTPVAQPASERVDSKLLLAIVATGLMAFIGILTETMMNVLFPTLMEEFHIGTAGVSGSSLTDTAHSRAKRRGNRADHVADAHQQAQT